LYFLSETNETEVGYLLSRDFWSKGYATESTRASLDYGFTTLGLQEIIGLTHPENTASQRVLQKCNMAFTHRAQYFGMEMARFSVFRESGGVQKDGLK
jgi:RimJ/RimL family protein N-acetyltransferase